MNDYISREAALNLIECNDKVCHYADERYENVVYATAQTICKAVAEMPAADVQPVKHGYWVEEEPRVLKCSVCGEYAPMNYLGQNCVDSRYCPWCGARMDGDSE